jgi:hypothetical protein
MNAQQWELYDQKPGAAAAARQLTTALNRALAAFDKAVAGKGVPKALSTAWRGLYAALVKQANFGACDTEPRYVARLALAKHAAKHVLGDDLDNFHGHDLINTYLDTI